MKNFNVVKKNKYRFNIWIKNTEGSSIDLNFKPVIEEHNLTGNFVIIHYQPKPFGLRSFGVYTSQDGGQYSKIENYITNKASKSIKVNEFKFPNARPSAVILFENAKVKIKDDIANIV